MELSTDSTSSFESHCCLLYKSINKNLDVKLALDEILHSPVIMILWVNKNPWRSENLAQVQEYPHISNTFVKFKKKLLSILKHVKCDLDMKYYLL